MRSKVFLPTSLLAVGLLSLPALPANAKPATAANTTAANTTAANTTAASATACSLGSVSAFSLGSSTSCIGSFSGNDAQGDGSGALLNKLSTGVFKDLKTWQFVGKSDESPLFKTSAGTSGNWSIANGITGPFVLSLKSSTAWSAYFFENTNDLKVFGGTWTTAGVSTNKQGQVQDLSHATLYRAVITPPPPKPKSVPEPGTMAALGLLAVGAFGRLKQKGVS